MRSQVKKEEKLQDIRQVLSDYKKSLINLEFESKREFEKLLRQTVTSL